MAERFDIFCENPVFTPMARGTKTTLGAPHVKAKVFASSSKKNALGDVSNVVSMNLTSSKPPEFNGKLEKSLSSFQQPASMSCKPEAKAEVGNDPVVESSHCSSCQICFDDDYYDIRPRSERVSEEALKRLTQIWSNDPSPPITPEILIPPLAEPEWSDISFTFDSSIEHDLSIPVEEVSFLDLEF